MRKVISAFLLLAMFITLCACGGAKNGAEVNLPEGIYLKQHTVTNTHAINNSDVPDITISHTYYDSNGNIISLEKITGDDAKKLEIQYTYDEFGRVASLLLYKGGELAVDIKFTYVKRELDEPVENHLFDEKNVKYVSIPKVFYDALPVTINGTEWGGAYSLEDYQYAYDECNRLIGIVDPLNDETFYEYYSNNNIKTITKITKNDIVITKNNKAGQPVSQKTLWKDKVVAEQKWKYRNGLVASKEQYSISSDSETGKEVKHTYKWSYSNGILKKYTYSVKPGNTTTYKYKVDEKYSEVLVHYSMDADGKVTSRNFYDDLNRLGSKETYNENGDVSNAETYSYYENTNIISECSFTIYDIDGNILQDENHKYIFEQK